MWLCEFVIMATYKNYQIIPSREACGQLLKVAHHRWCMRFLDLNQARLQSVLAYRLDLPRNFFDRSGD